MRRRITKMLLFLLLVSVGAIINIAVAWGSALWAEEPAEWLGSVSDINWPVQVPSDWPHVADRSSAMWSVFETRTLQSAALTGLDDREEVMIWSHDAGLPLRCLRSVELGEASADTISAIPPAGGDLQGGLHPPSSIFGSNVAQWRWLPVIPLWPGFAINTIFYATILWLLFAFPFVIRRRRRIKRGLCPACAYPVGTNNVCTECGKATRTP